MSNSPPATRAKALLDDFTAAGMNENAAHILVSALHLFAQKGYAATTVREIVCDADVTNPMLYYYFESKQGVFYALMELLIDSMEESVQEVLEQPRPIGHQLREIARAHFNACRNAPEVLRFVYSVMFGPVRSRPRYDVAQSYETIHELVRGTLEEAIKEGRFRPHSGYDAEFLTERFMGQINNHLMDVLTAYDRAESRAELEEYLDECLGDEALEKTVQFFFFGAGTLDREET